MEDAIVTQFYISADHTKWADADVVANFGFGRNDSRWMNHALNFDRYR